MERLRRPLRFASSALSEGVPRNKCSGLTHGGLSHLWQANNPPGIGPLWIVQEKR